MFKRYKPFFKAGAMEMLAFKFSLFTWFFVTALQVVCVILLWFAIYQNSPDANINGFTFNDMIVYQVMINIFTFTVSPGETLFTINNEIKEGTICMAFTKPISYRLRFIAATFGNVCVAFLIFGLPALTIAYLVFSLIGFIEIVVWYDIIIFIILFAICSVFTIIIQDTICYICGVLCFYTSSGWGINQIKDVIVRFLSGSLLPITFFPSIMGTIFSYLPFVGLAQNPVNILIMNFPEGSNRYLTALHYCGLNLFWVIVLEALAALIFSRASRKVTVQGG